MQRTKSLCMLVGSCQRTIGLNQTLTLGVNVLKQVCFMKYLGAYVDQHLTWQTHIDYVPSEELEGNFLP